MTKAKRSFFEAYRLARTNRRNPMWHGERFKFTGGDVYIGNTVLIISRDNVYGSLRPGFSQLALSYAHSRDYRLHCVERSREAGRVPLP